MNLKPKNVRKWVPKNQGTEHSENCYPERYPNWESCPCDELYLFAPIPEPFFPNLVLTPKSELHKPFAGFSDREAAIAFRMALEAKTTQNHPETR